MSKITLSFMQRFMSQLDTAIKNYVSGKITTSSSGMKSYVDDSIGNAVGAMTTYVNTHLNDKQNKPTIKTKKLSAGETGVTFTGVPTTGVNLFDIYTSKAGLDFNTIDDTVAGSLTLTYDSQSEDVDVYLRIESY